MVKRTHEMGKAGLSIPAVLKENKLLTPYRFFQAKRDWPQIIGKQIAKYSYIKDIDKNCVIIGVLNSIWMNQLFMYSQEIQKKLNDYIGEEFVHSVRFVWSGKKPAPVVYETLDGEEESDYPSGRIGDVVLSDDYVQTVRQETSHLPGRIREKMAALRFAQEKRRLSMEAEGFRHCPRCGRWLARGETVCLFCRLEDRQHKKKLVHDLLIQMPWLSLDQFAHEIGAGRSDRLYIELYNEVRRDCIYKLIERIHYDSDTPEDDLFLALFITRKTPVELTDDHVRNLANRYRKKE